MSEPPLGDLPDVVGDDRPPPHRGGGLVLLVLIGVVALVVVLTRPADNTPAVPPGPSPSPSASAAVPSTGAATPSAAAVPATSTMAAALPLDGQPNDVVVTTGGIYVTRSSPPSLLRFDPAGRRIEAVGPSLYDGAQVRVDRGVAWTWMQGGPRTTVVRSFDARTLRVLATATFAGYAFSATAYDGRLWLGTDRGLLSVDEHGRVRAALGLGMHSVSAVAADRARHQLLVADSDARPRLVSYDPARARSLAAVPIEVGKPSIAVTGDVVWVGGFGAPGDVLLRSYAEPTLAPLPVTRAAHLVGPGAIVTAGTGTLWLRDGGSTTLYCVDPHTGQPLQSWDGVMTVSSLAGAAYALTSVSVNRLPLAHGCRG